MTRAFLLSLLLAGCGVDPCGGRSGTCISLEIRNGAGVPASVAQIGVRSPGGFTLGGEIAEVRRPAKTSPSGIKLPAFVAVQPPGNLDGLSFRLEVHAYNAADELVGEGESIGQLVAGAHLRATVTLAVPGGGDDGGVDGGADGGAGVCDLVKQTGCKPGDKCAVDISTGERKCVVDRTLAVGAECEQAGVVPVPETDQCKKGLVCLTDQVFNTCYQACDTSADCTQGAVLDPDNLPRCQLNLATTPPVKFCSIACNPIANTGCNSGSACRVLVTGSTEFSHCPALRGIATEGQACGPGNNCEDGLTCFSNTCRKPCLVKSPLCGGGTSCTPPFSGAKPFGFCCPGGSC